MTGLLWTLSYLFCGVIVALAAGVSVGDPVRLNEQELVVIALFWPIAGLYVLASQFGVLLGIILDHILRARK